MFKVNDVKNIFGIESGRSSEMGTALEKYKSMRSGIPYWCTGRIKPTRFSNVICREIANLTLFNTDIQITGNNELQKRFDSVMNTLQEKQEESCATCGMMVKSNGDDVEFLDPDYFLITDTNTDGDALAAIFFSYLKKMTNTTQKQSITDLRMSDWNVYTIYPVRFLNLTTKI